VTAIVKACERMSSTKTGALIVVARQSDPLPYTKNGEELDAKLSSRLIESIFYKNSPLHDGAILVAEDRISVTRAVLPVTDNEDFPAELGMRHRSAVGITEQTDAISIIVSEQTGGISYAKEGKLMRDLSVQMLEDQLNEDLRAAAAVEKDILKGEEA
jgi:diadenylate cyclase